MFGFLENFFFISLGITFGLILLLIYHFKQRITAVERKGETVYELLTNIVKEINVLKNGCQAHEHFIRSTIMSGAIYQRPCESSDNISVHIVDNNPPQAPGLLANNTYGDSVNTLNSATVVDSAVQQLNVVSDSESDDDDDYDSESDENITVSDADDDTDNDDDEPVIVCANNAELEEVHELTYSREDAVFEETPADTPQPLSAAETSEQEDVSSHVVYSEPVNNPQQVDDDNVSVVSSIANTARNSYNKLSLSQLRALASATNSIDASRMKKQELVQYMKSLDDASAK